jgi:hypothetical protein
MFTKSRPSVPEAAMAIVPVRPAVIEDQIPASAVGLLRRTLGRNLPSRRTLGVAHPSRRTFGVNHPSRRTLGVGHPSRRTFGLGHPSRRTLG